MEMTPKQRILGAIRGSSIDRVPFSPFLAYYFENLDEETQKRGQLQYLEEMGADPLLRGFGCAWTVKNNACTAEVKTVGDKRYSRISTPVGDLISIETYTPSSNSWFLTTHPVETVEQIKTLQYYYEHMEVLPQIEGLNQYLDEVGERGLALPILGTECKTCFQGLLEHWIGTENLVYLEYDYPDEFQELLETMRAKAVKTIEYTAMSQADGGIFWEDSSTTNISPTLYAKYVAPEITHWANLFKQSDKLLVQHACGHLKDLLPIIGGQGIAALESLSPAPTGNVTVRDAVKALPQEVAIIGGIEPVFLLNESEDRIEEYVREILEINQGRRYVVANSDSCPPGVDYRKFLRIVKTVAEFGKK